MFAAVTVTPTHVVALLAAAALTRPTGYVSVNAAPVIAAALPLESVIVSVEAPLTPIALGPKALATVGCVNTVSVAVAAAAEPALPVETAPVELRYAPAFALVTFTVTVHEPLAGTVAPESATLAPLLAAVTEPPTQVVAPLALAVFARFAGYASVNAAPVIAVAFGFVSVIVRTLASLVPMDAGAKALATVSPLSTVIDALAAAVLAPAFVVVRPPIAMVLLYVFAEALVTVTVTVHEPLAGMVAPESAALVPAFAAVTVPPAQVVAPEAGVAFTRPPG